MWVCVHLNKIWTLSDICLWPFKGGTSIPLTHIFYVVCLCASFLSFDIPIHLFSLCHVAVWVALSFMLGISCMIQNANHNCSPICKQLWPGNTPGNSASYPDPNCLTLRHFSTTLSNIKTHWKLEQTRNLKDDNLFGGLMVTVHFI